MTSKGFLFFVSLVFLMPILACCQSNSAEKEFSPSDEVYPLLDAANSRWFFFASACRPFGMVTLNPDTQVGGAWGSGYRYDTDTIKGLSHIHGWQIAGASVMPVHYNADSIDILDDFYSSFKHEKETAAVGYHKIELDRYGIKVELTSTKRVGFHQYTFTGEKKSGILFQMYGKLGPSDMKDGQLIIKDANTLHGEITNAPTRRRPKDFKVYYVVKLDHEIDGIIDRETSYSLVKLKGIPQVVKMKVGISYTSHENALKNIQEELPLWGFEEIVSESKNEWNDWLGKVRIQDEDSIGIRRFYTDLWHALQGRRTISDVNGAYPDYTGETPRIGQLPLNANGKPLFNHYNSDSFWGAQWTINTLWGLLYPEVYSEMVRSLMVYYKDGGLIPRGPSGGNYTYVMTGASSTPFIVSAFQKGIEIGNSEEVYNALRKNHMKGGIMAKAGYEHETLLGGGLDHYIENGYVPYPIPEGKFGFHQDGASLTMEYAFQDFTLAQMALKLGKMEDYQALMKRSLNYKNVYDASSTWMRPKDINGKWKEDFDPYQYENGFNESNGAQSTWFVGHDISGLADLMGGKEKAVEKLNQQFLDSEPRGFTAGDSHERGEDWTRARIPINYGNQPSMQTAFIFNELGRPDLTQKWVSAVVDSTFSGISPYVGYKGDEDQGLMGALAVILKLGMFQLNGGTEEDPSYSLTTPLFRKVELILPNSNLLTIEKEGEGSQIIKIEFKGEEVKDFSLKHSQLLGGGLLKYYVK